MQENTEPTLIIDTSQAVETYRTRTFRMASGTIVHVPINEGSRGPLYTSDLTSTTHGKLRTTTKHYHLSFDIPLTEGLEYAGQCVEKEINHFIEYMLKH